MAVFISFLLHLDAWMHLFWEYMNTKYLASDLFIVGKYLDLGIVLRLDDFCQFITLNTEDTEVV